ncbi:MAG: hypothetical protein L0Y72_21835 [Gemmataceae bacterium]|nr:hypothetical protein [Gemmataceae bacterium]MCI0741683.1 hypothetical protein [Gemmataceae bacterium]
MKDQMTKNLGGAERLKLANDLFHEYYAQCFWHWKPDLLITEELVPILIQDLKKNGGRRGMLAADELEKM